MYIAKNVFDKIKKGKITINKEEYNIELYESNSNIINNRVLKVNNIICALYKYEEGLICYKACCNIDVRNYECFTKDLDKLYKNGKYYNNIIAVYLLNNLINKF